MALTIGAYVRLSHMISGGNVQMGFEFAVFLTKCWILLLVTTQTLSATVFMWGFRSYERVIRKLAESHDA